ncbi:MAG: aminotransferase class V-fold PLP-dependent enzyme [Atribacterota bacterium]|nr:aminotransferase class V-fold PLP-dependent enzyme [Atribacterota bacterium]MDD4896966.1 aminotransferase class V-fold PLP-dependent enzyme [Atribacterota bacterium]MDD5637749.1 aminotransferase class V-fold PLP-dependent enzyme [Atribacterota bacterium]
MVQFKDLGINKIINAAGTLTGYSGSLMSNEVLKAMELASQNFVDINELMQKSGEYLAKLLNVEAAMITSGASSGLLIATAACISKGNLKSVYSLPNTEGMKNEIVVMRCHRNPYDSAMITAGAKFVEIGNVIDKPQLWELDNAIGEKTAAIGFFVQSEMLQASLSLTEVLNIAHYHNIPVIVDAAAELPPVDNFQKFIRMGADIVIFSGGKDIRGPQSSGIMLGKKEIIECCRLINYPNITIGRPLKLDKETIIGLVTAVELYLKENHQARIQKWHRQVKKIIKELSTLNGIIVSQEIPQDSYPQPFYRPPIIPRVFIEIEENKKGFTQEDFAQKLYESDPPIVVRISKKHIAINPHMLYEGEDDYIIERIIQITKESF